MTLAEFWPQCLRRLHDILPAGQFAQWIAPLTVGEENGVWVVYGKNQFACNMLKSQFAAKIEVVRAELAPQQAAFAFKTGAGQHYEMAENAEAVAPEQAALTEEMPKAGAQESFSDGTSSENSDKTGSEPSRSWSAEAVQRICPQGRAGIRSSAVTCLSGRKSSPRKRVWCKPPWVQIPPSPPVVLVEPPVSAPGVSVLLRGIAPGSWENPKNILGW